MLVTESLQFDHILQDVLSISVVYRGLQCRCALCSFTLTFWLPPEEEFRNALQEVLNEHLAVLHFNITLKVDLDKEVAALCHNLLILALNSD